MICCLALACTLLSCGTLPVRWEDLPPALRAYLPSLHRPAEFDAFRQQVRQQTEQRLQQGEGDALLYYVLQARRFTRLPAIEPARAAHEYIETGALPSDATARFADFSKACRGSARDERLAYFCGLSRNGLDLAAGAPPALRFLYRKEFESGKLQGEERREFVASLYRSRGLSTDSSFDANFPVFLALRSLAEQPGFHVKRVLIVGPGLDFAPRTKLDDSIPPQSIQPFAVADALLQLGAATADRLRIHCIDINPQVVEHFRQTVPRELKILRRPGPDEYEKYFGDFGRAIGTIAAQADTKTIFVPRKSASMITAARLNILTEREAEGGYDLVVATNVLVYLDRQELALSFANIASMLRAGGYFIHNETREEVESIGAAAGMPVIDARMIRLLEDDRRAIFDALVIHRKASRI